MPLIIRNNSDVINEFISVVSEKFVFAIYNKSTASKIKTISKTNCSKILIRYSDDFFRQKFSTKIRTHGSP